LRQTLNRVHDQLDNDLNQVPITTNLLRAELANADVVFKNLFDAMEQHATEADWAIYFAVDGQVRFFTKLANFISEKFQHTLYIVNVFRMVLKLHKFTPIGRRFWIFWKMKNSSVPM